MDGLYYALNPGAILRRMFPKQLKTPVLIIIWAVIFVLNIVLVVLVQNFIIYKIADEDLYYNELGNTAYFKECDVIEINYIGNNDYCVKYINEENEKRIVCLDAFPADIIKRFRVMKSTDMVVAEDGMILYGKGTDAEKASEEEYLEHANPGSSFDIMWQGNARNIIQRLAFVYVAIGFGMLLIEFLFYSVFHRLFRE